MPPNLIHTIALAIYGRDPTLTPFDDLQPETKEGYYDQAQAALEAVTNWLNDVAIAHP